MRYHGWQRKETCPDGIGDVSLRLRMKVFMGDGKKRI
jgi:hypothetical protein